MVAACILPYPLYSALNLHFSPALERLAFHGVGSQCSYVSVKPCTAGCGTSGLSSVVLHLALLDISHGLLNTDIAVNFPMQMHYIALVFCR